MINEMTAKMFKDYGLEVVALRYFNTYGIGENSKGPYSSVIWKFIESIRNSKKPVIYGDGKQSRDFVYVKDVAIASLLSMEKGVPGETYNIGSGRSTAFNAIFDIVKRETGYEGEAEYVKNPLKSYQEFTLADISKSKRILDYSPQFDIRMGVRDILDSLR
jgi:UDP-glucose 4-epimerase